MIASILLRWFNLISFTKFLEVEEKGSDWHDRFTDERAVAVKAIDALEMIQLHDNNQGKEMRRIALNATNEIIEFRNREGNYTYATSR